MESYVAKTDSTGNFWVSFESYLPLDVWVAYKTNFLVLLHPGDSLYMQFDAFYNERPEFLASIRFSGDAAKTNQNAVIFQQMYFSNEIYYDWDKKLKAVREYEVDRYLQYLDSVQQKCNRIYEQFVADHQPDKLSKKLAKLFTYKDYHQYLGWYVRNRRQFHHQGWNDAWNVPKGFYDGLHHFLPVDPSMYIGAYVLSEFSFIFNNYVNEKLMDRRTDLDEWTLSPGEGLTGTTTIVDSIKIFGIMELVSDPLLRQIMLTNFFDTKFEKNDVYAYDRYRALVDACIKEPFLKEPLTRKYRRIVDARVPAKTVLYNMTDATHLSGNNILDDLIRKNKGKLLYIGFWATWAGQCFSEMYPTKDLQNEFSENDIELVYFCLESEDAYWKSSVYNKMPGGQHYLLSKKQSADMRTLFGIKNLPFYLLIDRNGVVREKGNHLTI